MELKNKWVYGLLLVSVALNIFVFGVWIGKGARSVKGKPPPSRLEFNIREIAKQLPLEAREDVRRFMQDNRKQLRETFEQRRQTEKLIRQLLTADVVDKEALRAALDAHTAHSIRLQAPVRGVLLGSISDLDKETRQKIAKTLFTRRAGPERGPRPRGLEGERRRPPPRRLN
jgi:uncharacterized membrane protein